MIICTNVIFLNSALPALLKELCCRPDYPNELIRIKDEYILLVRMWIYTSLLLKVIISEAAIIFPASPCPDSFTYEDDSFVGDRWYGELVVVPSSTLIGFTLRLTLDKSSHLLVLWTDEVMTNDNRIYLSYNPDRKLNAFEPMKIKIMVKFDPSQQIPFLSMVHFNGRRICPPDVSLTLTARDSSSEAGPRPDLEFPEPTDVFSDKSKTTTKPTLIKRNETSCGVADLVTPLITHGASTQRGQWPWHVALYRAEGVNLNYKCGATLVSKNKIITAAHCVTVGSNGGTRVPVNPNQIIPYFGKHKLHQFLGEEGVQTKQVTQIVVHPSYNGDTYYGDLAILTLSTDVEYTHYVRPVCLWEPASNTAEIEGKEGSVVGWGLDENEQTVEDLKVARMPVVSTEICLRSYPQFYSQFTNNGTYCAGYLNGTSPCNGDSGGAMVFNRNGLWYIRGIVSLSVAKEGPSFCNPRYYIIFTDVAKFSDFTQRNLI